jgi:hypothetical protein
MNYPPGVTSSHKQFNPKRAKGRYTLTISDVLTSPVVILGIELDCTVKCVLVRNIPEAQAPDIDSIEYGDLFVVINNENIKVDQEWFNNNFPAVVKDFKKKVEEIALVKARHSHNLDLWQFQDED